MSVRVVQLNYIHDMIISLDCDGVIANVVQHCADKFAPGKTHEDCVLWDIGVAFGVPDLFKRMEEETINNEFCMNIPLYPGAVKFVKELEKHGVVHAVTSPFKCSEWIYQRSKWLIKHFNIPVKRQHSTSAKDWGGFVSDILIDDKFENVDQFVKNQPRKLGLLLDQPWNRNYEITEERMIRCKNYAEIIKLVQRYSVTVFNLNSNE